MATFGAYETSQEISSAEGCVVFAAHKAGETMKAGEAAKEDYAVKVFSLETLLGQAPNRCLRMEKPLTPSDIIAERVGVRPLVMAGEGSGNRDWMQLSRKHAVEVNAAEHHISIFGGKLTDCLNVGEEITQRVMELGIALPYRDRCWYGEPPDEVRDEFFHQAALMGLDDMTPPTSSERLSSRLWRRYAGEAIVLLEEIRANPKSAELLIAGAEYLRCEIEQAARREMIVKLEDFLRRRSKISLVIPSDAVRNAAGLQEACRILFGDEADARIAEYFARH